MPSRFEIEPPIKRRGQKSALYKAQRSGQATPSRPHKLDRRVTFMDIAHYSKEDQLEFIESENNKVNRNYLKEHKIKQNVFFCKFSYKSGLLRRHCLINVQHIAVACVSGFSLPPCVVNTFISYMACLVEFSHCLIHI